MVDFTIQAKMNMFWAGFQEKDFSMKGSTATLGELAQLVARRDRTAKVRSSNLLLSISSNPLPINDQT